MKRILLLTAILSLALCTPLGVNANENSSAATLPHKQIQKPCQKQFHKPHKCPTKANFDKRLKLTDEQKAQAKEIHKKGFEEIKPIMDQIKVKKEEIEAVKRSQLAPEVQAEKIVKLRKEIGALKRQTREVQKKNMKEFESILTTEQKNELRKIKEEGRKKFDKEHKKHMFKMPPKSDWGCPKEPPVERPLPIKPTPVEK